MEEWPVQRLWGKRALGMHEKLGISKKWQIFSERTGILT